MEPRLTDLPLLQSWVDFVCPPGAPLRSTPGFFEVRLRRLRAHISGGHENRVKRIRETVPNPAYLRAIPPWFSIIPDTSLLFLICHFCLANPLNDSIPCQNSDYFGQQ